MATAYNAGTAHVNIKPNITGFAQELRRKLQTVDVDHGVDVNADTTKLQAQLRTALTALPNKHEIDVEVSVSAMKARQELTQLSRDRVVELDVRTDGARARRELDSLSHNRSVELTANADTSRVGRQLDKAARSRKVDYYVDPGRSSAAIDQITSKLSGLDRYQRNIAQTAISITSIGTAAAGAVGPLSVMVQVLAQAAGSAAMLPAALGGAIAGIAGIGVGASGIGAALGAMGQSATGAGDDTAKSMRSAQKGVEAAQRGVESAHRAVADAQRGVQDAHEDIERAERGVVNAQRGIRDSERDVARAQKDSREAQQDLNEAREDATEQLEDMNEQLRDSALDEEGAVLAVARAKQRLNETMADGDSTQLDRAEADLAYRESINSLEEIREKHNELAADVAEANRKGVEGSDDVVAAHERVEETQWQEMKAAEGLEEAQYGLTEAYRSLDDAHQGLADAHQAVADAQQGVLDAQDRLADSMAELGDVTSGATAGVDAFAEAMAKLSPNAQAFVRAIQELGPAWSTVKMMAQDALFHDLGASLITLADRQLPVLGQGLTDINSAFNDGIRSSMRAFSSEQAALDFSTFLGNSAAGFDILATAAAPLSTLWMDLATVGSVYLPAMSRGVADLVDKWSDQVGAARETGDLAAFMEESFEALGTTIDVVGTGIGTFLDIGRAGAEAAIPYMDDLKDAFEGIADWVGSDAGNRQLIDFFDDTMGIIQNVAPWLREAGELVGDVLAPALNELTGAASPKITSFLGELVDVGRKDFIPAAGEIGDAIAAVVDTLEPLLPVVGEVVGNVGSVIGALGNFVAAFKPVTEFFGNFPGVTGAFVTALMAVGGAHKFIKPLGDKISEPLGKVRDQFTLASDSAKNMYREVGDRNQNMGRFRKAWEVVRPTTQTAIGAFDGIRKAGSGLLDFLGGPWAIGFMAATAIIGVFVDSHRRYEEAQERLSAQARLVTEAQTALNDALAGTSGELGEEGVALAANHATASLEDMWAIGDQLNGLFSSLAGVNEFTDTSGYAEVNAAAQTLKGEYKDLDRIMGDLGIKQEDLGRIIAEGGPAYDQLVEQLIESGDGSSYLADKIEAAKAEMDMAVESAQRLDPGMRETADAIEILSDKSSTADEKLEGLRQVMQDLGYLPKDAEQALRDAAEAVDEFIEKVVDVDTTDIMGSGTLTGMEDGFDGFGDINIESGGDNARGLFDYLKDASDDLQEIASAGGDAQAAFDNMAPSLRTNLELFGYNSEEIESMIAWIGEIPEKASTYIELSGVDTAQEQLSTIVTRLSGVENGAVLEVAEADINEETRASLEDLGIKVEKVKGTNNMGLSIEDEEARGKLDWWIQEGMPPLGKTIGPTVEITDQEARAKLLTLAEELATVDRARPTPVASMDISQLTTSQIDALNQVGLLDGQEPTPDAYMDIRQLSEEQQLALAAVFDLNKQEPTPKANMDSTLFDNVNDHAWDQLDKLKKDKAKPILDLDNGPFVGSLQNAIDKMKEFGNWVKDIFTRDVTPGNSSDVPGNYSGGKLPEAGPGTSQVDGFIGIGDDGRAVARVNAGEWVINRASSRKYDKVLKQINMGVYEEDDSRLGLFQGGKIPGFYNGGMPGGGVATGLNKQLVDYVAPRYPGMSFTSGDRYTDNGHHSREEAADFSNGGNAGTPEMKALARDIYRNFGTISAELIHWPLSGWQNIHDGQPHNYGAGTNSEHRNHVHWAISQPLGPALPDIAIDPSKVSDAKLKLTYDNFDYTAIPPLPQVTAMREPSRPRPVPYSQKQAKGYNLGGMVEQAKRFHEESLPTPGYLIPHGWSEMIGQMGQLVTFGPAQNVPLDDHGHDPSLYGLLDEDLTGVGDSVDPLVDFRTSAASDPNSYDTSARATTGDQDTPTTWSGVVGEAAKIAAEGYTADALGVLGLPNEMPGAVQAGNLAYDQFSNNGNSIYRQNTATAVDGTATGDTVTGGGYAGYSATGDVAKGEVLTSTIGNGGALDAVNRAYIEAVSKAGVHTYDPSRGAEQWRSSVIAAHQNQGLPISDALADAFVRQIDSESTGDPAAVQNIWDENGTGEAAGVGLLQFIPTTWADYRDPTLPNDRKHAWANLNAGARYGNRKYGDTLLQVIGQGHGWKNGGDVWGPGGPRDDAILAALSNGEHVTNALSAEVARPLLNAMNDSPALAAQLNAAFEAPAVSSGGATTVTEVHYHIETNDLASGMRIAEMQSRRQVMAMTR